MIKLPRHLTLRVERETAEAFHAAARARGLTASAVLRAAVANAIAAPANAPAPETRQAA